MVSAVVLAAGMSTRMGRNKLLLTFRDKALVVHAVDTLLESTIGEIIVVLGHESEKVWDQLEDYVGRAPVGAQRRRVRLVKNPDYRDGLSTSVRTGVQAVSPEADAIMIYLADQPLLESADVDRIIEAFAAAKAEDKMIVVPFFKGERGNPVILDASLRDSILGIVGDVGCKGVIKRYPEKIYSIEMENDHVVRDVDDVQAYEKLVG
ncbi:MAG: nucleotidyltransferase family protein [Verrucomicrobia bacterium]|nr:nucleotidyltransferase family protein [Verrucomicrobiota bacterium]MBV8485013.1 nucleotidyltransferase family protein [Verrucomicrobiota bacterium]